MTLRAAGRLCWFAWEVVVIIANYFSTARLCRQKNQNATNAPLGCTALPADT